MHKVLIDTDPGIDDAMAIFYAGLHPDIDLIGMTSVFGNVTAERAARNALVLSDMLRQDIPVAPGAAKPLEQTPKPVSDHVHGDEGFGDLPAQIPSCAHRSTLTRPISSSRPCMPIPERSFLPR